MRNGRGPEATCNDPGGVPDAQAAAALLAALRRPWDTTVRVPPPTTGVVELARVTGLLPLLATRVEQPRARVEGIAAQARARAELAEVTAALREAGVLAVAFKGPLLAAAWPAGTRPCADLDVWLPDADDYPRAARALEALGLAPEDPRPPAGALESERAFHGAGRLPVDVHLSLLKPALRARSPRPGRDELRVVDGVLSLDAAWTLALAVVNLHQDLCSLRRIVDLALLLVRTPPDEQARAAAIVRRVGLGGVLRWGAGLASTWLDAPPLADDAAPTLAQRALFPRLSRLSRWADPPTWLNGRAPLDDRSILLSTVLRLALFDDAPRVVPERLLAFALPGGEYARRRGGPARRLLALGPRLLAALRRGPRE